MAGRVKHGTPEVEKKSAPLGIKIVGGLVILGGVLMLLGGLSAYFAYPAAVGFATLVSNVFFGILSLFLGFGLLSLKAWAWKGYVALSLLNFGATFAIGTVPAELAGAAFGLLLALYVYSKREAFS